VTDTARGILDGHIVLSRKIANRNHYPPIDVLSSVSRVMSDIVSPEHKALSNEVKKSMAVYADAEDLINIGAYAAGSNPDIDDAIAKHRDVVGFLQQDAHAKFELEDAVRIMGEIIHGEI
ncbi:MAG: EscN/YscN/HrcN family type III secretion system ATPase, partial [Defluviitaleaceae bacterium]|nr:EscN/YscN/HrcN family type III secretion system ATPase [Defluviitaleaceae bacterium]